MHLVKATVFPVVMYGCESYIINKAVLYTNNEKIEKLRK